MASTTDDFVRAIGDARRKFGVVAFWNAPTLDDPCEEARLVISRLRVYGGRKGWTVALSLERALRNAEHGWTTDTAVRFFPAERDPTFGWRLHDADIALNKLLALAGRRAARDYYDVVRLHHMGYHLGTLAWAAMGKDGGMSPVLVLDECSRNTRYSADELRQEIHSLEPIDPVDLKSRFLAAVAEARDWIQSMEATMPETVGSLVLDENHDLARLDVVAQSPDAFTFHGASVGGVIPEVRERQPVAPVPSTSFTP